MIKIAPIPDCRTEGRFGASRIFVAGLMSVCIFGAQAMGHAENDPHRPTCTSAECRRIKKYLRTHYCGESPFGNGPDDGCEIKELTKPRVGIEVLADYKCEWDDTKQSARCEQHNQPSDAIRNIVVGEMRHIGLPVRADGQTYFMVWKSDHTNSSLAVGYYFHSEGSDLELCEVVVLINQSAQNVVLRKLPLQKTDSDVPTITQWAPVDFADIRGDGKEDIVLKGDEYENHWLEVISVANGSAKTIFSGLGYYL